MIKGFNSVEKMWQDFALKVISPQAPDIQLREMRTAFYAGATSIFLAVNELGNPEFSEDAAADTLTEYATELTRFAANIRNTPS